MPGTDTTQREPLAAELDGRDRPHEDEGGRDRPHEEIHANLLPRTSGMRSLPPRNLPTREENEARLRLW